MQKAFLVRSILILAALTTGCSKGGGSGSSSSTINGVQFGDSISSSFIDAPVAGLNYSGETSTAGVTAAAGALSCNLGDVLTFKIGSDLVIGTAMCAPVIFIRALSSTTDEQNLAAGILKKLSSYSGSGDMVIPTAARTQSFGKSALSSVTQTDLQTYFSDGSLNINTLKSDGSSHIASSASQYIDYSFLDGVTSGDQFSMTATRLSGDAEECPSAVSYKVEATQTDGLWYGQIKNIGVTFGSSEVSLGATPPKRLVTSSRYVDSIEFESPRVDDPDQTNYVTLRMYVDLVEGKGNFSLIIDTDANDTSLKGVYVCKYNTQSTK